ncbi:allantoicase isoform X1 [Nerophis lumbriciformis]|uniref:allantoicase isoform X1 n=2 Tax=Nerophis lumbriciformis TaxID=546530 RepID=UPI002ADF1B65|nr:allantoicase isoform X1 [Nerophis lumbriciformis]
MSERRATILSTKPQFLNLNNLACESVGAKVVFATDEWFAPAANLLKREPPQFNTSAFTQFGKWMDGWETRRKRTPGHDWCLIQLGVPGLVYGVDVDTSYFTGNHPPHVSIQGACLEQEPNLSLEGDRTGMAASDSQLASAAKLRSEAWPELVGMSELKPGYSDCCHNYFLVHFTHRVTHLRLNLYPDGGVARLRVFGVGQRDWLSVPSNQDIDLLSMANGGVCLGFSNAHFGHPRNMIGMGSGCNMADGWETARRLDRPKKLQVDQRGILQLPGYEWAVFRLGHRGVIRAVEVDTAHFRGNFPDSCRVEVCTLTPEEEAQCLSSSWNSGKWRILVPPQKLRPDDKHMFIVDDMHSPVTHIRLVITPDGGVSRVRLWGQVVPMTTAHSKL